MVNIILCGFGLAAPGVMDYLLEHTDRLAVFTHDDLSYVPGLTRQADAAGVWHTTESINRAALPFEPDMIISIYYRYIIQPHIIEACNGRIFNAHPSLLPRHRGCSSIPWAMIEGDKETGVTFHYIDEGIDTGRIIGQIPTKIKPDDTQATLQARLAGLVVKYFPWAFERVREGDLGCVQIGPASYHPRQCPYDGQINPDWPIGKIERFIRAMIYPPLPPAKWSGYEIRSMNDYLQALGHSSRKSIEVIR
jgi:methionyl-tRNA formyltransferase